MLPGVLDARTAGNVIVVYVITPREGVTMLEQGVERHSQEQRAVLASATGETASTGGGDGNLIIQSTLGTGIDPVLTGGEGIRVGLRRTGPAKSACARSSSWTFGAMLSTFARGGGWVLLSMLEFFRRWRREL